MDSDRSVPDDGISQQPVRTHAAAERLRMLRAGWALLAAAIIGCTPSEPGRTNYSQPQELIGRWIRLRENGTWGDTLVYLEDGRVLGSQGHPVPKSARWRVKDAGGASPQFCAMDEREGYCQSFRVSADTLVLGGGPYGVTVFRRVR
jgi:hypothetical protein